MLCEGYELYNVEALVQAEGETRISRLPEAVRMRLNPTARDRAALSSTGVEIRFAFTGDCREATLSVECYDEFIMMQLYYGQFQGGWTYLGCRSLAPGHNEIPLCRPDSLPRLREIARVRGDRFSPDVMRLCFRSGGIGILRLSGETRPPRPEEVPARRALFYGSSITHGSLSHLPCNDFAWQVTDALGLDRINKGLAGACLLEPEMADYIAGRDDYAFAVLELGSNYGVKDAEALEEFTRRCEYLLSAFGAAHPDKPAFVIDDLLILHPDHAVKCCAVQEVLHRLNKPNLHYIHGDGLLPSVDCLSADLTHPTVEGHRAMADQLLRIIRAHWRG